MIFDLLYCFCANAFIFFSDASSFLRALSSFFFALSGLCRGSVRTLSGLCQLTTVGPLSASVGLCRPILTVTTQVRIEPVDLCQSVETPVGLSVCRSVGLCRSLSMSCRGLSRALNALFE